MTEQKSTNFYVWFANSKFGLTNDFEDCKKKTFGIRGSSIQAFHSIEEATVYLKSNLNKFNQTEQLAIKSDYYEHMIYVNEVLFDDQVIVNFFDQNFKNVIKPILDILPDQVTLNDKQQLVFDKSLDKEFARLMIYIMSIELSDRISAELIIFDHLPSFELLPNAGDIYKALLVYADQLKTDYSKHKVIREITKNDEYKLYLL